MKDLLAVAAVIAGILVYVFCSELGHTKLDSLSKLKLVFVPHKALVGGMVFGLILILAGIGVLLE